LRKKFKKIKLKLQRGCELKKKSKNSNKNRTKSKKIVENKFNLFSKGGDPRIYENSIFPAYITEKNKIIIKES
jgi:hypothetical protein